MTQQRVTNTDTRPAAEPWVRPDTRPEPEPEPVAPTLEEELAIFLRHEKPEHRALLERGFRTGWNRRDRTMQPVFARQAAERQKWDMAYHQHLGAVGRYVSRITVLEEENGFLRARVNRLEDGVRD